MFFKGVVKLNSRERKNSCIFTKTAYNVYTFIVK